MKWTERGIHRILKQNPKKLERIIAERMKEKTGTRPTLSFVRDEKKVSGGRVDFVLVNDQWPESHYLIELKYHTDPIKATKIVDYAIEYQRKTKTDRIEKVILVDSSSVKSESYISAIETQSGAIVTVYDDDVGKFEGGRVTRTPLSRMRKEKPAIPDKVIKATARDIVKRAFDILCYKNIYTTWPKEWGKHGVTDRDALFMLAVLDSIYFGIGKKLAEYGLNTLEGFGKEKGNLYHLVYEKLKFRRSYYHTESRREVARRFLPSFAEYFTNCPPTGFLRDEYLKAIGRTRNPFESQKMVFNSLVGKLIELGQTGPNAPYLAADVVCEMHLFDEYIMPSEIQPRSRPIWKYLGEAFPDVAWNRDKYYLFHKLVADELTAMAKKKRKDTHFDCRFVNYYLYLKAGGNI